MVENPREKMWRALPFVMAILLLTLVPLNSASALFRGKETEAPAPGAPVARNQEIKTYRGVPYTGTLTAVDNEGEAVSFTIVTEPKKGVLTLQEDGETFVYTPDAKKSGKDSFVFTATDEGGNVSAPATVSIRIERVASGVDYADTDECDAATAAMDLAERGIFVGARVGDDWFFEPDRLVTRGEFVAMALAAAGEDVQDAAVTGFCDNDSIPAWARGCAASALSNGLIEGVRTEEGVAFRAEADITLSEAAAVLNRLLTITDVDMSGYYYGEEADAWCAQAVANLTSVSILPAGSFGELSRGVTRAQAAELLSAAMALMDSRDTGGLLSGWFQ